VGARVLVAQESEPIREAITRLLAEAGYHVTSVADGTVVMARLAEPLDALVLDVAIPGAPSFEILDSIRARRLPTKTVLVASVYNRAGYKRRPTSLYGADDYVEQHHIPDLLLLKLARLLDRPLPDGQQVDAAVTRDEETIRRAAEARLSIRYRGRSDGEARARRLARLIVDDIALYNHDLLLLDDAAEQEAGLREDLEEGRLLFDLRVPREIREGRDFIGEALAEWLGARRGGRRVRAASGSGGGEGEP
jgi:CheY-like chemotaxis protein